MFAGGTASLLMLLPHVHVVGGVSAASNSDEGDRLAGALARAPSYPLTVLHDDLSFVPGATTPPPPDMQARAGILVDATTHKILWEANEHQPLPPASTTKLMTAMVVLHNFAPTRLVTVTPAALNQASDETTMGLKAGERLTVSELLDGMLVVSGNDAASALATDTVGMKTFVAAMNEQERALGLHDSSFTSSVGLQDPHHNMSAYDLAVIAAEDLGRWPLFAQIVKSTDLTLPATADHQQYQLHNLNQLLEKYPAADGVKPGYTGDAGACLVGSATRAGHQLIAVLLNGDQPAAHEAQLLDWGFAQEGLPRLLPVPTTSPGPRG